MHRPMLEERWNIKGVRTSDYSDETEMPYLHERQGVYGIAWLFHLPKLQE